MFWSKNKMRKMLAALNKASQSTIRNFVSYCISGLDQISNTKKFRVITFSLINLLFPFKESFQLFVIYREAFFCNKFTFTDIKGLHNTIF